MAVQRSPKPLMRVRFLSPLPSYKMSDTIQTFLLNKRDYSYFAILIIDEKCETKYNVDKVIKMKLIKLHIIYIFRNFFPKMIPINIRFYIDNFLIAL